MAEEKGDIDELLASKCLTERGYKLEKFIAAGGQGSLFGFCEKAGDCTKKVVKIILRAKHEGIYEREAAFFGIVNTTADENLSPKLYEHFKCKGMGFLVMDRYDGDMQYLAAQQAYDILSSIKTQFEHPELSIQLFTEAQFLRMFYLALQLRNSETIHGDLRADQFLQKQAGKQMTMIDFGLAGSRLPPHYRAYLGWAPDNWKERSIDDRVIPQKFWEYFNLYQLLVWFLERNDTNGNVTLIQRGNRQMFYLEDALLFPPGSPFYIPPAAILEMNRFLYGQDLMPQPSTRKNYDQTLRVLKRLFQNDLQPYHNPIMTAAHGRKTNEPLLPPTSTTIARKTSLAVLVPPIPAARTTLLATIVPPKKTPAVAVASLKMPCELDGYRPDMGRNTGAVEHSGYFYALFYKLSNGKRYLFRRPAMDGTKKWKAFPMSRVTSRKLRSSLGI